MAYTNNVKDDIYKTGISVAIPDHKYANMAYTVIDNDKMASLFCQNCLIESRIAVLRAIKEKTQDEFFLGSRRLPVIGNARQVYDSPTKNRMIQLTSIRKKQRRGDAIKPSETGQYRPIEGRFFPSRPVAWCILVIRRLIAFIYKHIFELTSPKTYESRLTLRCDPVFCLCGAVPSPQGSRDVLHGRIRCDFQAPYPNLS